MSMSREKSIDSSCSHVHVPAKSRRSTRGDCPPICGRHAGTRNPTVTLSSVETLSSAKTLSSAGVLSADQTFEPFFSREPDVRKRWLIYAMVEYGRAQAYSEATTTVWSKKRRGGQRHGVLWPRDGPWAEGSSSFKVDVSAASELAVYLFERKLDPVTGDQEVTSLRWIKLHPFLEP